MPNQIDSSIILGTKGERIIVDTEDLPKVENFNWNCHTGYARTFSRKGGRNAKLTSKLLHSIILPNDNKSLVVDHINGDKLDNRKCNLRLCTVSQNSSNRKVSKISKGIYLGVTFHKRDLKWQAQVRHNGIRYYCGYLSTAEEAAEAYDEKALQLHGEYAKLNFSKKENK